MNTPFNYLKLTSQTFEFEHNDGYTYRLIEDQVGYKRVSVQRAQTPAEVEVEVGAKQRGPLWSHGVLCQLAENGIWKPANAVTSPTHFNSLNDAMEFITS